MSNTPDNSRRSAMPDDEFAAQLAQHQLRLHLFIMALVPRADEAEDIRQNTNLVLWKKRAEFEPGTNFIGWALKIARLEVKKFFERQSRERPRLNDEVLAVLAEETVAQESLLESRRQALGDCMKKLAHRDHALVEAFYTRGETLNAAAERLGRPASSVRHSISRIRRQLKRCIDAATSREDRT